MLNRRKMIHDELIKTAKKVFLAYFRYYSAMSLKRMRKSLKKCQPA